jgi:hypothetical protein
MNALKKEDVIPEEVTQDLVDPVNAQTNREFRVVLNQRHESKQKQDSSNSPPSQSLADRLLNAREVAQARGLRTLGTGPYDAPFS